MIFDRALTPEESASLLDEVRPLLTAERFHARALVLSDSGATEQWHLEIDKPANAWFLVSEGGTVYEYRDGTVRYGSDPPHHETSISAGATGPAVLAFPERLLVWGGHPGHFRPVLVQRIGRKSLLITFEHGLDPSMRGTLVIDTELGLVTRFMQFRSPQTVLVDVEPGRPIERRVPDAYPELEVIIPEY